MSWGMTRSLRITNVVVLVAENYLAELATGWYEVVEGN